MSVILPGWPTGRVGFVAIVGRPNVGKSTFLNQVLAYHLAAVSAKPQTTRRHWRGILSDADSQIVFVDTPGAHVGKTQLNAAMLRSVIGALGDADVVLCLADPTREPGAEDQLVAERVAAAGKPALLALNKVDLATPEQIAVTRQAYLDVLGDGTEVCELAALSGQGCDEVLAAIRQRLPAQAPFFYPPDQLSDSLEREIGAELIREAAFELLQRELPHALSVAIDSWQEGEPKTRISATLHVERDSQKAIVLGKKGEMIGKIRSGAKAKLREVVEGPLELRLHVKVSKDWRNRPAFLRDQGIIDR